MDPHVQLLNIVIKKCSNATSGVTCQTPAFIDAALSGALTAGGGQLVAKIFSMSTEFNVN